MEAARKALQPSAPARKKPPPAQKRQSLGDFRMALDAEEEATLDEASCSGASASEEGR